MDNYVKSEKKSFLFMVSEEILVLFVVGFFGNSFELDYGVDIELVIVKLEFFFEVDVIVDLVKFISNEFGGNDQIVKIRILKDNKNGKRRLFIIGFKMNFGQEKSYSKGFFKKFLKFKTEINLLKNLVNVKFSNSSIDEIVNKVSIKNKLVVGIVVKKIIKMKLEIKSLSVIIIGNEIVKLVSEVDDEDVIVDIVGVEISLGYENVKVDIKLIFIIKEIERIKGVKNKFVVINGFSKYVNGDKFYVLFSLIFLNRIKDILGKNVEVIYDEVNMFEFFIVKIDLLLLKRIFKFFGNELIKYLVFFFFEINGNKDVIIFFEVKIIKRKLLEVRLVEYEIFKKVKSESDVDLNR